MAARTPSASPRNDKVGRISLASLFAPRRGRRLVTPSGVGVRGLFPSPKNGRMIEFESLGERNAAALLEDTMEVVSYIEQPPAEPWFDGERTRRYTPDFRVETTLGPVMVEIKPSDIARRPKVRKRHGLIKASLAARGTPFVVWTERHVARPRRAVAVLLAAARRGARITDSPDSGEARR